jgi:uncharacterized HAD superfamily protein
LFSCGSATHLISPDIVSLGYIIYEIKQGVCHTVALPFYIKKYLKATKEELWKLKYFTMQKYNLQKNPLKETKILQDIITL